MPSLRPIILSGTPADALLRWPAEPPLACMRLPDGSNGTWTILGISSRHVNIAGDDALLQSNPLLAIDRLFPLAPRLVEGRIDHEVPFQSGWIVSFAYELGRLLEPAVAEDRPPRERSTLISAAYCPAAILHHLPAGAAADAGEWFATGEVPTDVIEALQVPPSPNTMPAASFHTEDATWSLDDASHRRAVECILEHIAAGDVYQVNLTRRRSCAYEGSPRHFAAAAWRTADPRYGAILEAGSESRTIVSMSPELFIRLDPAQRTLTTRPIKGTRPSSLPVASLLESIKDAAELTMIVDLMRNDLGRVCRPGSVRVEIGRTIETHGTVHHGVAEIVGRPSDELTTGKLLAATFAPGSVTGAPRIAAMRLIERLEPVDRGAYCGAMGIIDDRGAITLNVAIRTAILKGASDRGVLHYGTGGGIVADSVPDEELEETRVKTRVLERALAACSVDSAVAGVRAP